MESIGQESCVKTGAICYVEFFTSSLEASRTFYEAVFGWSFVTHPGWDEYLFFVPPEGVGGIFKRKPEGITERGPIVHVQCEDINATLRRAQSAGGKVVMARTPKSEGNPEAGFFALIEDNVGNRIGLST
jgi:predicted enzyme related to lactoylglutathione lyase